MTHIRTFFWKSVYGNEGFRIDESSPFYILSKKTKDNIEIKSISILHGC